MGKEENIDVDTTQLIEEVHFRIDALLELLEEKGLINEAQYIKKLEELIDSQEEEQI